MIAFASLIGGVLLGLLIGHVRQDLGAGVWDAPYASARSVRRKQRAQRADLRRVLPTRWWN